MAFGGVHSFAHRHAVVGMLSPDFTVARANGLGFHIPNLGHRFDQALACFARCKCNGIADHVGLSTGSSMRRLGGARCVVVPDHDVLRLYAHLMRGNLRQHGQNSFSDLGHPGHDLGAAAVVEFSPGGRSVDHRGPRNAVPAGSHSSSALARHRLLRCFLLFCVRKTRTQRARRPNVVTIEILPSVTARSRGASFPAGRLL